MAVIEPGGIIVAHSLLFFLLTKMSIMELDGPSTCPSPWPDIRVQGCSSGLYHPAHVQSQFPCNLYTCLTCSCAASHGDTWLFGENRFKWYIWVAPVFLFRLLFLFWCCCYLLVCLFVFETWFQTGCFWNAAPYWAFKLLIWRTVHIPLLT